MLEVQGLNVSVRSKRRWLPILEDVNLSVGADETLAIVGESGSGKSMLALAIMGLLSPPKAFRIGRTLLIVASRRCGGCRQCPPRMRRFPRESTTG